MSYGISRDALRTAIGDGIRRDETDHRSMDAEFDSLAELLVQAIRFGNAEDVSGVHRTVEELRLQAVGLRLWKIVDHLDMAVRLLAAARRRLPPVDAPRRRAGSLRRGGERAGFLAGQRSAAPDPVRPADGRP